MTWDAGFQNASRFWKGTFPNQDWGWTVQPPRVYYQDLDLVVNSAGLTDFNPDLRLALSTNADSVLHLVEFLRRCRRAGLVHVSTCFVNGRTDGRVPEELQPNYTPRGASDFNARREWEFLHAEVDRIEQEAASPGFAVAVRS